MVAVAFIGRRFPASPALARIPSPDPAPTRPHRAGSRAPRLLRRLPRLRLPLRRLPHLRLRLRLRRLPRLRLPRRRLPLLRPPLRRVLRRRPPQSRRVPSKSKPEAKPPRASAGRRTKAPAAKPEPNARADSGHSAHPDPRTAMPASAAVVPVATVVDRLSRRRQPRRVADVDVRPRCAFGRVRAHCARARAGRRPMARSRGASSRRGSSSPLRGWASSLVLPFPSSLAVAAMRRRLASQLWSLSRAAHCCSFRSQARTHLWSRSRVGRAGVVASTSATFSFTVDDSSATVECSFDVADSRLRLRRLYSGLGARVATPSRCRRPTWTGPTSASRSWTVDTTGRSLSLPDVVVNVNDVPSAVVTFGPSGSDPNGADLRCCNPASGSTFPLGTTRSSARERTGSATPRPDRSPSPFRTVTAPTVTTPGNTTVSVNGVTAARR